MGLLSAVYSWGSVKALNTTVFTMNVAGIVAVALAIVWAVRLERGFGNYVNLVTPGDGHLWATVIIVAATPCALAYILGMMSYLYYKLESPRSNLENEGTNFNENGHDVDRLLFFHAVICLVSGFLVAILNAACLARLNNFQQKSRDGLIEAMENYATDVVAKARVDAVQTELECCGDDGYEDWFRLPWLKLSIEGADDAEEGPRLEGQSAPEDRENEPVSADVPFSCCSNDIPKPCVHHDILKPSAVYDYNPKHLTISTLGCRSKIISRTDTIRYSLIGYLALLSIYQLVLSLLSRLLYTAYSNERYIGPLKSRYHVWVFWKPAHYHGNEPLLRRVRKERKGSLKRRSKRTLVPPSPSDTSEDTEKEIESRKSKVTFLRRLRSKVKSVTSTSLPLVKSITTFSSNEPRQRTTNEDRSNHELKKDEVYLSSSPSDGKESTVGKSQHDTKDYDLYSIIPRNSSAVDLPPPAPPLPVQITITAQNEERRAPPEMVPKNTEERINATEGTNENVLRDRNSGRRRKVLETFGKISGYTDHGNQGRHGGGADTTIVEHDEDSGTRSSRSRRRLRCSFDPADVYDRFRGTLQHTLARRETIQARIRRGSKSRVYSPRVAASVDTRRSNLLARLRCNNVPPSYRLLADFEIQRRSIPPPPPMPPPLASSLWAVKPNTGSPGRSMSREQLQCSICNRAVPRTPDICRGTRADREYNARAPSLAPLPGTAPTFPQEREPSSGDDELYDRSTFLPKSVQQR